MLGHHRLPLQNIHHVEGLVPQNVPPAKGQPVGGHDGKFFTVFPVATADIKELVTAPLNLQPGEVLGADRLKDPGRLPGQL